MFTNFIKYNLIEVSVLLKNFYLSSEKTDFVMEIVEKIGSEIYIATHFKEEMRRLYGERLHKIILFGSYARGDFHQESDMDFLVVLNDENIKSLNEKKVIRQTLEKWSEEMSYFISPLPISKTDYLQKQSPLLFFIRKEGKEI